MIKISYKVALKGLPALLHWSTGAAKIYGLTTYQNWNEEIYLHLLYSSDGKAKIQYGKTRFLSKMRSIAWDK